MREVRPEAPQPAKRNLHKTIHLQLLTQTSKHASPNKTGNCTNFRTWLGRSPLTTAVACRHTGTTIGCPQADTTAFMGRLMRPRAATTTATGFQKVSARATYKPLERKRLSTAMTGQGYTCGRPSSDRDVKTPSLEPSMAAVGTGSTW